MVKTGWEKQEDPEMSAPREEASEPGSPAQMSRTDRQTLGAGRKVNTVCYKQD